MRDAQELALVSVAVLRRNEAGRKCRHRRGIAHSIGVLPSNVSAYVVQGCNKTQQATYGRSTLPYLFQKREKRVWSARCIHRRVGRARDPQVEDAKARAVHDEVARAVIKVDEAAG
jgi:hypothetical protein